MFRYTVASSDFCGYFTGPILFILFINDLGEVLSNSQFLVYADDIKIYRVVKSPFDAFKIFFDLDKFFEWALQNCLPLNILKGYVMRYSRGSPYIFDYNFHGTFIQNTDLMNDLGVTFDSKFTFERYLQITTSKAYSTLGFILRNTSEFKGSNTLIYLHRSLVLPVLSYCSVIWSPFQQNHIDLLESVNHRFLRYMSFKINRPMMYWQHDYADIANILKVSSIKSYHDLIDYFSAYCKTHRLINCSNLSDSFVVRNISYNLRHSSGNVHIRITTLFILLWTGLDEHGTI